MSTIHLIVEANHSQMMCDLKNCLYWGILEDVFFQIVSGHSLCIASTSVDLACVQTPLVSFLREGGAKKMYELVYKVNGGCAKCQESSLWDHYGDFQL